MKTYIFTILITLFSFGAISAQENTDTINLDKISTAQKVNTLEDNIDTVKIKKAIARSSSDIRILLNRERKVENINIVFPNIIKRKLS